MVETIFSERDLQQISERGITVKEILSQIEIFKKGFPKIKLHRPCKIGDGITVLSERELERLGGLYLDAAASARAVKFVPASGAASRMFKSLLSDYGRSEGRDEKQAEGGAFLRFVKNIKKFAFYEDLRSSLSRDGLIIEELLANGQYRPLLEYTLTPKGINLSDLPKGVIPFHKYPERPRTPFDEQLIEAMGYTRDKNGVVRIHFTVSPEYESAIEKSLKEKVPYDEGPETRFEISFSIQKPSTDTIAVTLDNSPFRDQHGQLFFRPGGHGALLKNLSDLQGDIIFIKNIDNVVPDRLKPQTVLYKRALGGYLVELQGRMFGYIKRLIRKDRDEAFMKQALEFARGKLSIFPPDDITKRSIEEKSAFLISKLNRPLRVCGMVKNEGEPGGGPFWVEGPRGTLSLQIVESSQVDIEGSIEQKTIWESSTHFNPVDLVCGVRDHLKKPFDLMEYLDPETGFISIKSKDGMALKALERPGLWNGSMAGWNTVFIEVPGITFNPVKTVFDLLRPEHQP
ncbi:MAG: DUF4301 family protein [Pseudomonadota bacterium]